LTASSKTIKPIIAPPQRPAPRTLRQPVVFLVAALALVAALFYAGTFALRAGGYCADEFLPGEIALPVEPYVQNVTEGTASILWRTTIETDGRLAYGETRELGLFAEGGAGQDHHVRLTGLKPDTVYFYTAGAFGQEPTISSFRTAPAADSPITFAVIGDSGTGGDAQATMAGVLAGVEPRLVLHTGDVVYRRGAECHYAKRFFYPYQNLIASVPVYPALGNHDLLAADGAAYFETFDLPANNPERSERYYSFDYGPVHFVALDSELYHGDGGAGAASAQKTWLEADLQQTAQPWTVVYLHRSPFSTGKHGDDEAIVADLVPLFAREGVDVVFGGHTHAYERFVPRDGVTYVVSGGGGARLHNVRQIAETAVAAKKHHVLKVTATPDRLAIEAVDEDGQVFDRVELAPSG
jgi:hypothetical protein